MQFQLYIIRILLFAVFYLPITSSKLLQKLLSIHMDIVWHVLLPKYSLYAYKYKIKVHSNNAKSAFKNLVFQI